MLRRPLGGSLSVIAKSLHANSPQKRFSLQKRFWSDGASLLALRQSQWAADDFREEIKERARCANELHELKNQVKEGKMREIELRKQLDELTKQLRATGKEPSKKENDSNRSEVESTTEKWFKR